MLNICKKLKGISKKISTLSKKSCKTETRCFSNLTSNPSRNKVSSKSICEVNKQKALFRSGFDTDLFCFDCLLSCFGSDLPIFGTYDRCYINCSGLCRIYNCITDSEVKFKLEINYYFCSCI